MSDSSTELKTKKVSSSRATLQYNVCQKSINAFSILQFIEFQAEKHVSQHKCCGSDFCTRRNKT